MDFDPTFVDILTASTDEDARAKAQIMARQLRGDKTLGMMALGGGRLAAPLGKEMLSDADSAEKGLLSAGVNRLHYGQQMQDMKARQDLMKQQTAFAHDETLKQIAALRAAAAGQKGLFDEAAAYKDWTKFSEKFNPFVASGRNPLGLNQNLINRAGRLKALVDAGNNPDVVITSQLVRELEMGIAALGGSSSGQLAKSAVDEIANKTLGRSASEALQFVMGSPQDARAKEFIKQALWTIGREHEALTEQQRQGIAMGAMSRRKTITHPSIQPDAMEFLKAAGFDDSEIKGLMTGSYKPTQRKPEYGSGPDVRANLDARVKELVSLGKSDDDIKIILKSEGY